MQLQTALGKTLDARTRDSIALAVSQANGCRYCVCAHSHVASTFNGFSETEIAQAREGALQWHFGFTGPARARITAGMVVARRGSSGWVRHRDLVASGHDAAVHVEDGAGDPVRL
jgi:AhpD family alkylhydroperoxidase